MAKSLFIVSHESSDNPEEAEMRLRSIVDVVRPQLEDIPDLKIYLAIGVTADAIINHLEED